MRSFSNDFIEEIIFREVDGYNNSFNIIFILISGLLNDKGSDLLKYMPTKKRKQPKPANNPKVIEYLNICCLFTILKF